MATSKKKSTEKPVTRDSKKKSAEKPTTRVRTAASKAKATRTRNFNKRVSKEPDANRNKMIEYNWRKKQLQREIWG